METLSNLADEPYAARIAGAILASFMQQPPDTKTMMRLLTTLCTGMPKETLRKMVDPRIGVASRTEIFSLAAVKKWLDDHGPQDRSVPEHRLLPPLVEEQIAPEERTRRVKMLHDTARIIRDAVRTKCVGRPAKPKQVNDENKRLEALKTFSELQS